MSRRCARASVEWREHALESAGCCTRDTASTIFLACSAAAAVPLRKHTHTHTLRYGGCSSCVRCSETRVICRWSADKFTPGSRSVFPFSAAAAAARVPTRCTRALYTYSRIEKEIVRMRSAKPSREDHRSLVARLYSGARTTVGFTRIYREIFSRLRAGCITFSKIVDRALRSIVII
ncbi:unnamed protein product [Trichogramma brassicae]|uniref:Uncharacterized protein n=1 Tax=Trichogramma brassicae TaxID=86971 RepID=A0A6H5ITC3_9HYME|nr:unnamed protein product [Trichogramma brassicae]